MNKERRKRIKNVYTALTDCKEVQGFEELMDEVQSILDDEEDAFDNMPEGLQCSERGEASEEAQEYLQEAIEIFERIIDLFNGKTSDEESLEELREEAQDNLLSIY